VIDIAREVARVRYPVLAASAVAWTVLAAGLSGSHLNANFLCTENGTASAPASLAILLALNPPSAIAAAWALMLVAMMSPLLIPAIHHIRFTSFTHRRTRSIALFLAGYGAVWMTCGALLTGIKFAALALAPQSYIPAAAAAVVALAWQASPFKQRCLNGCHDNRPLAAFGLEADLDALRFGLTHGLWCVAACGALMLFAILLPQGHLAAMAAVAILMFCERLEDPEPPRWKMRGLRRASLTLAAWTRIRLRMLLSKAPRPRRTAPESKLNARQSRRGVLQAVDTRA
jgi:predicted metal-binding membrane protein